MKGFKKQGHHSEGMEKNKMKSGNTSFGQKEKYGHQGSEKSYSNEDKNRKSWENQGQNRTGQKSMTDGKYMEHERSKEFSKYGNSKGSSTSRTMNEKEDEEEERRSPYGGADYKKNIECKKCVGGSCKCKC